MNTVDTALQMTRKLDYIQAMIWARINDEVNARNIKLTVGDCYALGSVIKEVLHPEVRSLTNEAELRGRVDELERALKSGKNWEEPNEGTVYEIKERLDALLKLRASARKVSGSQETDNSGKESR